MLDISVSRWIELSVSTGGSNHSAPDGIGLAGLKGFSIKAMAELISMLIRSGIRQMRKMTEAVLLVIPSERSAEERTPINVARLVRIAAVNPKFSWPTKREAAESR